MTPQELERRKERAVNEPLIISAAENGFRVYSPMNPGNPYYVTGLPDAPVCTCPDFDYHKEDPDWRCKHILAVLGRREAASGNDQVAGRSPTVRPERPVPRSEAAAMGTTPSQLVIKRSVSPDRRIDSLSVEISLSLSGSSEEDILGARRALDLESDIVDKFLSRIGPDGNEAIEPEEEKEAAPAKMLTIAGMNTRYGRSLFITVQTNGETVKYFGSRKQLAEAITAAGSPKLAERIEEGVELNIPCRVVTKPSEDGKYLKIEKVLPPQNPRPEGRVG